MKITRSPSDNNSSSSEFEEFHRRKLRLKVKLAEDTSEDGDELSPQPPQQPQRKHFCVICEKQFSSGKAYGGHVRIHSTEYNNKGKMKKMAMKKKRNNSLVRKEKEKEIDLIRADMEGKIRCCLCGKEFQTMHSLFGHMRRHPDRSWKGIRPPSPPEKFNLSYLGHDEDVHDGDGVRPPSPREKFDLSYLGNDEDVDDGDDDYDSVMSRSMMTSEATEDVQEAAWILMSLYYSSINCSAGMETALESPKSEVRSLSCYKGKDNALGDGGIDEKKGLIVGMKIEMEIEVKVNNPRDESNKSSGFDLNKPPYHEDHPSSSWN